MWLKTVPLTSEKERNDRVLLERAVSDNIPPLGVVVLQSAHLAAETPAWPAVNRDGRKIVFVGTVSKQQRGTKL